ncbi:Chaoptin [Nymphon striatum]|nr:Chaoptin [Nymphon striatum]
MKKLVLVYLSISSLFNIISTEDYLSPCIFNPLCTCSKSGPDLGEVRCHDVPFMQIPKAINESQMFLFSMSNNGLRVLPEHSLHGTGTWRVEIINNKISRLDRFVFSGLERSLWQLILRNNRLTSVPTESMKNLRKLKHLDLSSNSITKVGPGDFDGIDANLKQLDLAKNTIDAIAEGTFQKLGKCKKLDLSSNYISKFQEDVFAKASQITELNLANNLLTSIPFAAVSSLAHLNFLNLKGNRIAQTFDVIFPKALSLDTLILSNNEIEKLSPFAFQNFDNVNKTFLNNNPLTFIDKDAFKDAKIKEIHASESSIKEIAEDAFNGLEASLHTLNLKNNDLSYIKPGMFRNFDELRNLDLTGNKLNLDLDEVFNGSRYTIQHLYLSGHKMSTRTFDDLRDIRNLRTLSLSSLPYDSLEEEHFAGISLALKKVFINRNALRRIGQHAFYHMPGVETLDFSSNNIERIDQNAFYLKNALDFEVFPFRAFDKLTNIRTLDISSNHLHTIPNQSFKTMREIEKIDLRNNDIGEISGELINGHNNPKVTDIHLETNKLIKIPTRCFRDLENLKAIHLQDNDVFKVERSSFVNLKNLLEVDMVENNLAEIAPEAFQNLPNLQLLDLSRNYLREFNLHSLDQVGALSNLKVNLSHNSIKILSRESAPNEYHLLPIRTLDISSNNISEVHQSYFEPVKNSITKLDTFGKLQHLQLLDIGHSEIINLNKDALFGVHRIQILRMNNNNISDFLVFEDPPLEILDISYNRLSRMPVESLLKTNNTLSYLDLSFNRLRFLEVLDFSSMTRLIHLNLAGNHIIDISAGSFAQLSNLVILDMKHLLELNISSNIIKLFDSTIFMELPGLKKLDLSKNKITRIRKAAWVGAKLEWLDISQNHITKVFNDTFEGLEDLRELKMHELPLLFFDTGALGKAPKLESLSVSTYDKIRGLKFSKLTHSNYVLQRLEIAVHHPNFYHYLDGKLQRSLSHIKITGKGMTAISVKALSGNKEMFGDQKSNHTERRDFFFTEKILSGMHVARAKSGTPMSSKFPSLSALSNSTHLPSNLVNEVYLSSLMISHNKWKCNCEIGWIKPWRKMWNKCSCADCFEDAPSCQSVVNDMRQTKCVNLVNKTLVDAMKYNMNLAVAQFPLCLHSGISYTAFLNTHYTGKSTRNVARLLDPLLGN